MEDFDFIDALTKTALSDRTVQPSPDGWQMVQQKMMRKKRKRLLIYILLFTLLCSLGIYIGVHKVADVETTEVSKKNTNTNNEIISNSTLSSTLSPDSNSHSNAVVNDDSQAETNTSVVMSETKKQQQTTKNSQRERKGVVKTQTGNHSRFMNGKNNVLVSNNTNAFDGNRITKSKTKHSLSITASMTFTDGEEDCQLNAAGLKLASWELITPEMLKKKRKKRRKSKKAEKMYDNLDLMVGFNGFVNKNDYDFIGSYIFELSYTVKEKLKKKYTFNYGASLQFRNLRLKNDSISFNRGELSMNVYSGLERRFGNFGVEAGGYLGYEFYSPNNEVFGRDNINFFDRKINYGLFSTLYYKKVGLVFKYEFSPYINYLGARKSGAFTIGVKYDF